MKYYGNYCGPNYPEDPDYSIPAIDEFDQTCKEHDINFDDPESDQIFFNKNNGKGLRRTLAAYLVKYPGKIYRMAKTGRKKPQNRGTKQATAYMTSAEYQPLSSRKWRSKVTPMPTKDTRVRRGNGLSGGSGQYTTPRKIPAAMNNSRQSRPAKMQTRGQRVLLHGTERVGEIGVVSPSTGDLLYETKLCPAYFKGTRLRQMAMLYQRYRYKHLKFVVEPTCGTTTPGGLAAVCIRDPKDVMPTGTAAAAYVNANEGAHTWPCFASQVIVMPPGRQGTLFVETEGLYQYDDERLEDPGRFVIIANNTFVSTVSICTITMDYEIEFWLPTTHWQETQLSAFCNFENVSTAHHPFTGGYPMLVHSSCNYEWISLDDSDPSFDIFTFHLNIGDTFLTNYTITTTVAPYTSLTWHTSDLALVPAATAIQPAISTLDGTTGADFYYQSQGSYTVTGPNPSIWCDCVLGASVFTEAYAFFALVKPGGAWVAPTSLTRRSKTDLVTRLAALERLVSAQGKQEIPEVTRPRPRR